MHHAIILKMSMIFKNLTKFNIYSNYDLKKTLQIYELNQGLPLLSFKFDKFRLNFGVSHKKMG